MPTVVIVEPYRDLAIALQEVVQLARCQAVTLGTVSDVSELPPSPAAIVVRVATNLPYGAPPSGLADIPLSDRPIVRHASKTR